MYKKTVHTRNVTVTLNLTDSLNLTESNLNMNLSRVLHTIQVGGSGRYLSLSTHLHFVSSIHVMFPLHLFPTTGDSRGDCPCVWLLWWSERSRFGGFLHVFWSGHWQHEAAGSGPQGLL